MKDVFPRLKSNPKAEDCRRLKDEVLFARECREALRKLPGSSDLSRSRKELYRDLVVGSTSDPLVERLRWSLRKICSQWNWAPGSSFLNNWQFARNALLFSDWVFRVGLADMPDCLRCGSGLEETALHVFCYYERVRPFWSYVGEWTARNDLKQLELLDFGSVVDNIYPLYRGEKCVMFLAILAVPRVVIWRHARRDCMTMQTFLIVI